jgi:hypothetical protein
LRKADLHNLEMWPWLDLSILKNLYFPFILLHLYSRNTALCVNKNYATTGFEPVKRSHHIKKWRSCEQRQRVILLMMARFLVCKLLPWTTDFMQLGTKLISYCSCLRKTNRSWYQCLQLVWWILQSSFWWLIECGI